VKTNNLKPAIRASLSALCTLLVSYAAFRWVLMRYWEWQHQGRKMMFTFWADFNAVPLALLTSISAFVVIFVRLRRAQTRS
jgi:hypothetical protein